MLGRVSVASLPARELSAAGGVLGRSGGTVWRSAGVPPAPSGRGGENTGREMRGNEVTGFSACTGSESRFSSPIEDEAELNTSSPGSANCANTPHQNSSRTGRQRAAGT